ncbi:MAG: RNase adapter RapZ [Inquilinus sp.]|nr:RNase adapter RapZ [Inquilinus sp.]
MSAPAPLGAEVPRRIVLVTGLSGAGMSSALNAFEDLGYEAVDNLPLTLVPALIGRSRDGPRSLAVGVDSRTRNFTAEALLQWHKVLLQEDGLDVRLLFLDCDADVLQRRYTETRRRHPLAADRPVVDGIAADEAAVGPLREHADLAIDTSTLSIHDLRRLIGGHFALAEGPRLSVFITSFSFGRGLPREADLVFDVRFLDNPHWNPDLRPMTGLDAAVRKAVEGDSGFPAFFDGLTGLLRPLLPRYNQEGKSYLTIAIGCTGGRHRSVVVAERLAGWMGEQGYRVGLQHRELPVAE